MIPLTTAEETRRAEEAYAGSLDQLMERAGTAVAEAVLEFHESSPNRFPSSLMPRRKCVFTVFTESPSVSAISVTGSSV